MTLDSLDELICQQDQQIPELADLCEDPERTKEDILETVRDFDEEDADQLVRDLEQQWEDAWDFIMPEGAYRVATLSAVTSVTAVLAFTM